MDDGYLHYVDPATNLFVSIAAPPHTHADSMQFNWIYDTVTTMADPGLGKVRTDTAAGTPPANMAISTSSDGGIDVTAMLKSLTVGDLVYFQRTDSSASWGRYRINAAPVVYPTWVKIPIETVETYGPAIVKNQLVLIRFTYGAGGGSVNMDGRYLKKAGDAITGVVTAPTPAVATNNTQIATTAYTVSRIAQDAPTKAGAGAGGTWTINVTGTAATATDSTKVAKTGDGMTGALSNDGYVQVNNGAGFVSHYPGQSVASMASFSYAGAYGMRFTADWSALSGGLAPLQIGAPRDGNSAATVDWVRNGAHKSVHVDVGTLAASTGYGPWAWGHNIGNLAGAVASGTYDDGIHSIVASIGNPVWDGTNVWVTARNVSTANEACAVCVMCFS